MVKQRIYNVCTNSGPISDWTLSTLLLASGESISRHVSVQMVDILNTFCEQTRANNWYFCVFLVQLASAKPMVVAEQKLVEITHTNNK